MKLPAILAFLAAALFTAPSARAAETTKPNIVVILADDLGYGDAGCYGATHIKTPNIDRLAREGLRFTDGHCTSGTCTPSRFALMTGGYPWRQKGTNILPGNAALIIKPGSVTLPAMLQKAGYTTGAVGKWHLGLGSGSINWNGEIKPGPREIGFDFNFILPATGDRVPCVYVENSRVAGLDPKDPIQVSYGAPIGSEPTGEKNPDLLKLKPSKGHNNTIVNGIGRIGFMTGGKAARWKDEDMADVLTKKAAGFIEKNKDKPFYLYFASHDPHVPRVPHPRFVGKSQCGVRGDVIVQLDWCVGEILATLKRLNLADNTLVVFSSDNGPVIDDGYADGAVKDLNGHKPGGPLRGGKYTPYEGGTRVPFITRWPGRIKPGVSEALVCQVDLLASFAALVKRDLPAEAAVDSINVLPALLGEKREGRDHLVEQGGPMAIRKGLWKYIPRMNPKKAKNPTPAAGAGELYNLADDLGEEKNLAAKQPEKVKELSELLRKVREEGRSRPKK